MKKIVSMVVLILFVASANLAAAGPGGRGDRGRDALILEGLNLTPEQMEKIRVLKASYLKEREPLRNQLYTKRMELKLLWMQTKPEAEKIKSKQKEIHDLKWQLIEKRRDHRLAFREVLTPEQLSKYILLAPDRKKSKKKKGSRGRW
jgi:Spy/CpxP family protein refolding chaperone